MKRLCLVLDVWGIEYDFSKLEGVSEVVSGYSGGKTSNPTYEQVCSNSTEHAEVVMIDYDETVINYEDLLDSFWKKHDPTTLNNRGLTLVINTDLQYFITMKSKRS